MKQRGSGLSCTYENREQFFVSDLFTSCIGHGKAASRASTKCVTPDLEMVLECLESLVLRIVVCAG